VSLPVRLTPEAEADVSEAEAWYRGRGLGLGDEFLRSLDASLQSIARFPESCPVVHRPLRRALLRRFPSCVFYVAESERIVVVGVLHARRDPQVWQRRSAG